MKKNIVWLLFIAFALTGRAQLPVVPDSTSIVDYLQQSLSGGKVRIRQDSLLYRQIGRHGWGKNLEHINNMPFISGQGFRIQIFSGNNQRESKNEAFTKERMVKDNFPELETYVTFHSPFWRLRAGNFRTYEEADRKMRELKNTFPSFGKEMYIVREEVKFPLYQPEETKPEPYE